MILSIFLFVLIQTYMQVLMWENLAFDVFSHSYAAFIFCGSFFFIKCLRSLFCSLVPRIPCHNTLAAFPLKVKLCISCAFQKLPTLPLFLQKIKFESQMLTHFLFRKKQCCSLPVLI